MKKDIKCPPDCPHLATNVLYHQERTYRRKIQRLRQDERLRTTISNEDVLDVLLELEDEILRFHSSNPLLGDQDVVAALDAVTQTLRASASGLVLPAPALSHNANALRESLNKIIEKQSSSSPEQKLEKEVTSEALNKLMASVRRYQSQPGGYLSFLASVI